MIHLNSAGAAIAQIRFQDKHPLSNDSVEYNNKERASLHNCQKWVKETKTEMGKGSLNIEKVWTQLI